MAQADENDRRRKRERSEVADVVRLKPGFAEFYRAWKKQKNKEEWLVVAGVAAAAVVGAAMAAASSSKEDQIQNELRHIRNKVDSL